MEIILTSDNFVSEVLESTTPVLVDFWAPWCGPCRMMAPIFEQVAQENPDIKCGKVNVDECPELAMQFGVMSIPTFIAFDGGKEVARKIGGGAKADLLKMVNK